MRAAGPGERGGLGSTLGVRDIGLNGDSFWSPLWREKPSRATGRHGSTSPLPGCPDGARANGDTG
eukprot:365151-Chlamydomonas_euryale.AAC.21